jgi:hypothetical protein
MLNITKDKRKISEFMKENQQNWDSVSDDFFDGAFIGDGIQGAMVIADDQIPDAIRMLMGRYDIIEDSMIDELEYCHARLYAGSIIINPQFEVSNKSMKLDLWNGEVSGVIEGKNKKVNWSGISEREHGVFIIKIRGEISNSEVEAFVRPEWGISPSFYLQNKNTDDFASYLPPKPEEVKEGDLNLIIQKHRASGSHVTAWKKIITSDASILLVSLGVDYSENKDESVRKAVEEATDKINKVIAQGVECCIEKNRQWWNQYTMESMLVLPEDEYWQKFWWMQIYKFGCASAEESDLLIDNLGPWTWKCDWGGIWWNLNIQLSYFPMFSANKLKTGRSLINGKNRIYDSGEFHRNSPNGIGITVGRASTFQGSSDAEWAKESGNLAWVLHNYWKYWKYSGSPREIGEKLFQMLSDNVDYLISILEEKEDGKLHMMPSRSPEYPHPEDKPYFPDTNYALMGLRWGLQALKTLASELGINYDKAEEHAEAAANLVEYPRDENGFKINAEQSYDVSHRHYSHLLAIYPYHTLNPETGTDEEKQLIRTSLEHWQSKTEALQGYSYTGGCAMYAILGEGDKAIELLDKFKSRLEPNTMYKEGGGPVIETPLSGVEAINYLLLQSWGEIIRVFPAVPERWRNVEFSTFGTEMALLVSGKRENGKNIFVSIENSLDYEKTFKIRPNLSCPVESIVCEGFSNVKLLDDKKTFELILKGNFKGIMKASLG